MSKPTVLSFRAYSMDQIIMILKQRLMALPYIVFQPQAFELCLRKVAASFGDMRKALGICRCAIERLEIQLRESTCTSNLTSMVRVDHMVIALSTAYKSPIVETIHSLPQHQQTVTMLHHRLCVNIHLEKLQNPRLYCGLLEKGRRKKQEARNFPSNPRNCNSGDLLFSETYNFISPSSFPHF
ncbi:hypothetical protein L2E82_36421 [Cichorium intybus]|uniref:Uncharacterized protein n=1 Tax=Cichorium intybus TaxID=13427 RepID=A0ACB9BRM1_CICIN|nr:hypothetical protein L2E82_36421 [Cichorium intybus]